MHRYIYLILLLLMAFTACSRNKPELSTEANLKIADDLYSRRKYAKAALIYDKISFERKSAATAYATMRQADCYYEINKFSDARSKYLQFISSFPDHKDVSNAYFRVAECFFEDSLPPQYDQDDTISAIESFQGFIERFPEDQRYNSALSYIRQAQYKLLEKKYINGYIYYKMKDYSAALMYFDEIVQLGNNDALDRKSLYYSAKLHLHQKNTEKAQTSYQLLTSKYAGSKEARKLSKKFK